MKFWQVSTLFLTIIVCLPHGTVFAESDSVSDFIDDVQLNTIVVTAQKREQTTQEVPIAVSRLSGDEFEQLFSAGDDILAMALRIPGLSAETANGRITPRFFIRGLGNTDFDLAASQPVSIIMDNVVMENVVLRGFPLFDIEGVEVIRGPQGSLFGRNTTAGVIKFSSRKPTYDFDAYATLGLGEFGIRNLEAAIGGGISDKSSMRLSILSQNRDDWVSNGYTNENDVLGGFVENAFRLQYSYEPGDELNVLVNYHSRKYDGFATLFRANILDTGSNQLNENYQRETVYYDEGDNNPAAYDANGAVVNITYDLGESVFTSITALESAEGSSMADIDGGFGAVFLPEMGPGFIPFPSVTRDRADVRQFTQEFHLASDTDKSYTWQTGIFYFDSELSVITDPFFINPTTVNHRNIAWAMFGQITYDLSENTTFVGGLRYSWDEKRLSANSGAGLPIEPVNIDDDELSWEMMFNHKLSPDTSVYTRIANGFRAQSIQGRDIAFYGSPSTADSESLTSYEIGFKSDLHRNTLRLNGAIYTYEINDIQLTKVGGNGNNIGLDNADNGSSKGFEFDTVYRLNKYITLTASYSYHNTEIQDSELLIPVCGSGLCTVLDPVDVDGNAYVDGNPFPHAPKSIMSFTGRFAYPLTTGEVYAYIDYVQQGETSFFIYDSLEFKVGNQSETGLRLGYINNIDDYEIALFGKNITSENNIKGAIDFNNNTAFVNGPEIWGIEFKQRYR